MARAASEPVGMRGADGLSPCASNALPPTTMTSARAARPPNGISQPAVRGRSDPSARHEDLRIEARKPALRIADAWRSARIDRIVRGADPWRSRREPGAGGPATVRCAISRSAASRPVEVRAHRSRGGSGATRRRSASRSAAYAAAMPAQDRQTRRCPSSQTCSAVGSGNESRSAASSRARSCGVSGWLPRGSRGPRFIAARLRAVRGGARRSSGILRVAAWRARGPIRGDVRSRAPAGGSPARG